LPADQQLQPLPEGERLKEPNPQDSEVIRRDFKIFRNDVIDREKSHGDGFTPDCPGCTAIRVGTVARNHTNICRDRYADSFMQSDKHKHRVILANRRLNVSGEAQAPVPPQQDAVVEPIREDAPGGPVEPNLMSDENVNEPIINNEGMDVGLLAQIAIEHIKFGVHVAELFSPPRVTALAVKVGFSAGFAFDLTQVDAETGKPWNFSDPKMRDRAWEIAG